MDSDFPFHTTFVVRIGDINYGGHMGNDKLLLIFHDARIRYLQYLGYSEFDIGGGAGLLMTEAHIAFKGEVFLGDELLVGVKISDPGKVRFNVEFQVEKVPDKKIVATGSTLMAVFNYNQRKACRIPDEFLKKIVD